MAQVATAKARYEKLSGARQPVLDKARQCTELTIPTILPPDGFKDGDKIKDTFQSQGARGVNNLASKLLTTLLPPNAPFFKLTIDSQLVEEKQLSSTDVDAFLSGMEQVLMRDIEVNKLRVPTFAMLRLLISTGNALVYYPPEVEGGGMRVFNISQYVVERDPMGIPLEIITKEKVNPLSLSPIIQAAVMQNKTEVNSKSDYVDVYTRLIRRLDKWEVTQEVAGINIPESEGTYALDSLPWLALRWNYAPNMNYGVGVTEEYIGDHRTLEALSQAMAEGTAAAAKVLMFLDPSSPLTPKKIASADNLEVLSGSAADVTTLQVEKRADFATALQLMDVITQRLSYAYLLNTSVQRQAERVTAEEIRYMAGELEDALGGVYSVLSQEFQAPTISLLMKRAQQAGRLPEIKDNAIEPMITTGLEGLGRGHDLNKLQTAMAGVRELGDDTLQYIRKDVFLKQWFSSLGIKTEELVYSQEEIAQQNQQNQQGAMAGQIIPDVAKEAAKAGMQQQTQPQG